MSQDKKTEILLAEKAGFCFGVERAERIVLGLLENRNKKIHTLGPLIHNPLFVEKLESKGINVVEENELNDIDSDSIIVIRSHGIEKRLKKNLLDMGFKVIDATCPFVDKAKKSALELFQNGYFLIILGDANHPEVKGIRSYTDYQGLIVKDLEDVKKIDLSDKEKIGFIAQTTQSKEVFSSIVNYLEKRVSDFIFYDTICNATSNRQKAAVELAGVCDAMIVIGGFNSANTKRLVEICTKICKNVIWIEKLSDLDLNDLNGAEKIGITAGASTPGWSIDTVYEKLRRKLC